MKKNNILYLLLATFIFASCNENLDLQPLQSIGKEIALSTSQNVEFVLNGAYDVLSESGGTDGGDIVLYPELLSSNGRLNFVGTFNFLRDMSRKEMLFNNSGANAAWVRAYAVINQTNIVLGALDIVDADKKDRVRGEALFLRAFSHFNLVQIYAKPYSDGNATSNPGIILMTTLGATDANIDCAARNTVEEVYNSIIDDLTIAANLVPVSNSVYANKATVLGILSRVYLQKLDYANALTAVNNAISNAGANSLTPNYADAFASTTNTSEDIFAIQITQGEGGDNDLFTYNAPATEGGRGDINYISSFRNTFAANDTRLNMFDGSGFVKKWFNQFGNINILRLAELYLTRAECNIRLSQNTGDTPLNDYNRIHTRAGLTAATTITLENILSERVFEFFSEGQYFYDQQRLQRTIGTFSFDSDKLVFPIPTSYTVPCPDVIQNAAYSN
jgi:hypothetical protein